MKQTSEVSYSIPVRPIYFIICCKIGLTIDDNIVMSIAQYTMHIMCFIACNLMKTSPKTSLNAATSTAHAYSRFYEWTSTPPPRPRPGIDDHAQLKSCKSKIYYCAMGKAVFREDKNGIFNIKARVIIFNPYASCILNNK